MTSHDLVHYGQIIRDVLKPYGEITDANVPMRNRVMFDDEYGQYLSINPVFGFLATFGEAGESYH